MVNTDNAIPRCKEKAYGMYAGSSSLEKPRNTVDREARIRFLQESASYMGVRIKRHDLIARYIND